MTHCCELCSIYWDCQLKWYRGERGEEQVCCPLCRLFYDCNPEIAEAGIEEEEKKNKRTDEGHSKGSKEDKKT